MIPKSTLVAFFASLFLWAYLGVLMAVAVHEVVGHGLTSIVVGGDFRGVMLGFDGMGWADTPRAFESPVRAMTVLMGGVTSTVIVGLGLGWLTWRFQRRPAMAGPLSALAAMHMLEGGPYMLVNSVHPAQPGDMARLIELAPGARWPLIIFGTALVAATMLATVRFATWLIESLATNGRGLSHRLRVAAGFMIAIAASALEFTFDWESLAPGVGSWPNLGFSVGWLASAAVVVKWHWVAQPLESSARSLWMSVGVGLIALGTVALIIGLWLRHGWSW